MRVKEKSLYNTLEMANIYKESDYTIWSQPDFLANIRFESISDPLFSDQWNLKNTGQCSSTVDVDIDAELAWDITKGDSSIIIAIIDDGVESHEDFYSGQLVSGYTANTSNGDGSPCTDSEHGQCVAGIAVAGFNSYGGRGVTEKVRIMSINISDDTATGSDIALAIDTARILGADILNISWHMDESSDVTDALWRADTLGREEKGCLIVKSAGNAPLQVTYPAAVSGVVAVGAIDCNGNRAAYSPRRPEVDVVAPSSPYKNVETTQDIRTMDRMGSYGYKSSSNYFNNFGQTSAAAPHVSGIGALILSINPNLNARVNGSNQNPQLQNIIMNSADDKGTTDWDGYGLVNAYDALIYTLENYGGALSDNVKLHSSLEIKTGATLSIAADAVIDLNSESISTSGGTISIASGATIIPSIKLKNGSSVIGLYPTLVSAANDAVSGNIIELSVNDTIKTTTTIPSGVTVKYASGKSLYTTATLNATNVTFNRISGTWGGIKYLNGSSGTLDNCTISNSTYGVYCNSASPTIKNSDISNCSYGIYSYNSTRPKILNNDISGSTYDIYNYNSSPRVTDNDISGGTIGMYCDNSSSPELYSGDNYFHNSYVTFGVWADDGSNPHLGDASCMINGNNSFVYSMVDVAHVHAGTNCAIPAENNWWGTSSPSGIASGSVDWNPYLTSMPSYSAPQNPETDLYDQNISFASIIPEDNGDKLVLNYNNSWSLKQKVAFLRYLYTNEEYTGITNHCKDIINDYPESLEAFTALDLMYQITRKPNIEKDMSIENLKTYLVGFENKKGNAELNGMALSILAGFEGKAGLDRLDNVMETYPKTDAAKYALYQKFMYYVHDAEDIAQARTVLAEIDNLYPEDRISYEAHLLLGDDVEEVKEFYAKYKQEAEKEITFAQTDVDELTLPNEYKLESAYPNPFNPSTTLDYALPVQSDVSCTIFDLSGNIVKAYNVNQNAGHHSIVWDGSDASSGIYLIRFMADAVDGEGSFVDYQKVTLLK